MSIENNTITITRKPIRRLILRVRHNGQVCVSAPWHMPEREIETFIQSHQEWIRRAQQRIMARTTIVQTPISKEEIAELTAYLQEWVEHWRTQMGEAPIQWRLRDMKSQWGNCRAARRLITFNKRLIRVPEPLREYIIVHELAHLKVQNHSALFYQHVAQFIPDWSARRRALKAYALT